LANNNYIGCHWLQGLVNPAGLDVSAGWQENQQDECIHFRKHRNLGFFLGLSEKLTRVIKNATGFEYFLI
jgi:hypothetical protein